MRLTNPSITFQSSSSTAAPILDLTEETAACTFSVMRRVISRNKFGGVGQNRNRKGRDDGSFMVDFDQDYSTSAAITRRLFSYLLAEDVVNVVVIADGEDVVSSANPKYTFQIAVDNLDLIDGNADDGATAAITWPIHGVVSESTTP